MKEAASESSMTVIAIILIGIIIAVAMPLVKNMMETTSKRGDCINKGLCVGEDGNCTECGGGGGGEAGAAE